MSVALLLLMSYRPKSARPSNKLLKHVKAIILFHGETDRYLLELTFDADATLNAADWKVIHQSDISFVERPKLAKMAELLREKRLRNVAAIGKRVGRNEQCPCGSGKKFKKCCIDESHSIARHHGSASCHSPRAKLRTGTPIC